MSLAHEASYLYRYSKELRSLNKDIKKVAKKVEKHRSKHAKAKEEHKSKHYVRHQKQAKKLHHLVAEHKTIVRKLNVHLRNFHLTLKKNKI